MDFFFNILKKGLVATMFLVFAFTASYVPQLPTSHVQQAEAGGAAGGGALEITQQLNRVLLGSNVVQSTITAGATAANWTKENVLDGIGWAIAKRIVSGIIRSLIDWVNSGFAGSPAFVTDLKGFLLNIADEEIGRVISELGDIGSFICSPFRLDAQIAVALEYSRSREQQSAPTCTLTGVINNIQGFISGIDPGNGLSDWLTITSAPKVYTPYGAALSAKATAHARLINAQGEEIKLLEFGDGFQSQKICRSVSGFTGSQDCSIVKPGRVIADQLNKALGAGQDALIEADEINELIAALLGQLANQALTGVAGILGLSGGTGFGGYSAGPSYLDNLYNQSNQNAIGAGASGNVISDSIASEQAFRSNAQSIRNQFDTFARTSVNATQVAAANAVITEIDAIVATTNSNIIALNTLSSDYASAVDDNERVDILIEYATLDLTSDSEAAAQIADWTKQANRIGLTLN